MDQIKIGQFVAQRRKNVKLTQAQLAEKLGITDKAVSKWERGLTMPDVSIMQDLCDILGITVNDLIVVFHSNYLSTNQRLIRRSYDREGLQSPLVLFPRILSIYTSGMQGLYK